MKTRIVPFVLILMFSSSCTKEDLDNIDYFSFGSAHGFCQGNCADFFMIKDGAVYPDDIDYYSGSSLKFKSEPLTAENYKLAKKLVDGFPSYLIKNPDRTFGCPDCADQGGIHIEIKEKGQIKRWHFDTAISNLPAGIQEYVQEMTEVIEELK